jgi:hypothetical protein
MASANAPHGHPSAPPGTMFIDRIDRILAASRHESALPAKDSAKGNTVEQNKLDQ